MSVPIRAVRALAVIGLCLFGGGAGAHGQTVSVDTTASAPVSETDAALQARLQGIYDQVDAFRGIEVRVRQGVVHLSGTVVQPQQAVEAAELARTLEGVLYVENQVSAETDLADRVTPAISRLQSYGTAVVEFLPVGLIALLVVLGTVGAGRWIGGWEGPGRTRLSPMAWGLVRRVLQFAIGVVGLVVAFDLLGVTSLVGALLGTAGVAGLAVGFAFRDIIENYLAGVLLSLRQPFRVNDVVSIAEHEGRVVRLTARELVLLTFEGNHVRLPNATVFKGTLVNYTLNPRRLFSFEVGVGVGEDLAVAQRIGSETLEAMPGVMEEPPPFSRVEALGDSSVVVRFHGWVYQDEADFHKVRSEAIRLVKQALDEAAVDMPEPTYRLQLYQAGEGPPQPPKTPERPVAEQVDRIDVARDGRLEQQVEEELRASDEPNLLSG